MDVRALCSLTKVRIVLMPEAMALTPVAVVEGAWRVNSAARSNGSSMLRFTVLCTALVTMLSTVRLEMLCPRLLRRDGLQELDKQRGRCGSRHHRE